jgi:hypothetical protein
MLVVYRSIRSLRGGCIYKRFDVMAMLVHSHNINTHFSGRKNPQDSFLGGEVKACPMS